MFTLKFQMPKVAVGQPGLRTQRCLSRSYQPRGSVASVCSCDCDAMVFSARPARNLIRLFLPLITVTMCIGQHGNCFGQALSPTAVVLLEEAEEDYYDGDLKAADRRTREAYKWVRENKNDIAKAGGDHPLTEAYVAAFHAEVLHALGESVMALAKLKHAEAMLKNRRNVYLQRGLRPSLLWQFEAYIYCVRGDIARPIADFGLASDGSLSKSVSEWLSVRGESSSSIRAYLIAEDIMSKPVATANAYDLYTSNRSQGRVLTSLAWARILRAGRPLPADVSDAVAFLERAETAFKKNKSWRAFIDEKADWQVPRAFKDIDKSHLFQDATQQTNDERRRLKRLFSQAIYDWLQMQLLRVELSAFQEQSQPLDADSDELTTEQRYDEIVGFLKVQYGEKHPRLQRANLSRARWLLALFRSENTKVEGKPSLLRDCLRELDSVTSLGAEDMLQKRIVEFAARVGLLSMDADAGGIVGEERDLCEKRVEELRRELDEDVAKSKAKQRPLDSKDTESSSVEE